MAVLDHFEATIRVNGKTAQEYDVENEDEAKPTTAVKYIEAISDAEFSFHFILRRTYESNTGLHVIARVDGQSVSGILVQKRDTSATRSGGDKEFSRCHLYSTSNGQSWKIPFRFSAVVTRLFPLLWAFG